MSDVSSCWWEDDDFHAIEDGEHFVYTNARLAGHTIAVGEGRTLVRSEKIVFGGREPVEVLEVPYD